jgi:hypothetical protein
MGYQKRRFTLPWDHSTLYKSLRLGWMALGDPRHFREEVGLYIELAESGSSCISGPLPLVIPGCDDSTPVRGASYEPVAPLRA